MSMDLRNEIREAVREEVSRLFAVETTNLNSSRDIECASRDVNRNHNNPTVSASSSRSTPGCSSASSDRSVSPQERTLSFEEFYQMRERQRQTGFKPAKKKRRGSSASSSSTVSKKPTNVDIKVGIAQQTDGVVKVRRGKTHLITVNSSANEKDITHKAKEKHASFDQSFDQAVEYVLLYPDFREVKLIPGTTQPFILCDYKDAIGKDYKRLTFYLIPVDELLDNSDDSDGEVPKTVSSSSDIRHYGFTPTGAAFEPVEQSFTSDSLTHFEIDHTVRRNSNALTSSASSGELILNAYHYQRAKAILQMSFKLNEVKKRFMHIHIYFLSGSRQAL